MIGQIVRFPFYKNIYKNIIILNTQTCLLFTPVDIILNQATYFSMKSTYTSLDI